VDRQHQYETDQGQALYPMVQIFKGKHPLTDQSISSSLINLER
jgi:hypothetical protein